MTTDHKAGLTKENFFNDLYTKYPKGLQVFCDWIDEYKEAVEWDILFNNDSFNPKVPSDQNVKFHDLPVAMQEGIFWAFVRDRGGCQWEIEDMFAFDFVTEFTELVKMLQNESEDMG